jgi:hypothetical protein
MSEPNNNPDNNSNKLKNVQLDKNYRVGLAWEIGYSEDSSVKEIIEKNFIFDVVQNMKKYMTANRINQTHLRKCLLKLDIDLSASQITSYLDCTNKMPFYVVFAFCEIFKIPFTDLLDGSPEPGRQSVSAYFPGENTRYSFNKMKPRHVEKLREFLMRGKKEVTLQLVNLPLATDKNIESERNLPFQSGEIVITDDKEKNIFRVDGKLTDTKGIKADTSGLIRLIGPRNHESCWVFLKRDDTADDFDAFVIINFLLGNNEGEWNVKTGLVLDLRRVDDLPIAYRTLLVHEGTGMKGDDYLRFLGFLHLNVGDVTIESKDLKILENYLRYVKAREKDPSVEKEGIPEKDFKDLEKHFNGIDMLGIDNSLDFLRVLRSQKKEIYQISYDEKITINKQEQEVSKVLDGKPLLCGWLAIKNTKPFKNKLSKELDDDVEKLYEEIRRIADKASKPNHQS